MKISPRKIPACMATQHPDHASKPYWHDEVFIPTLKEARECFLCFSDLGIDEYKWDWEGKLVDESVLERLLADHWDFFKNHPLGKNKFLTFRLPNPKVETEFRMGRALMGLASAAGLAKQLGLHSPPLFEVILPMTESAEEMIDIQEAFAEVANLKHRLYHFDNSDGLRHIQIIPLFEQVSTIVRSSEILEQYIKFHKWKFGFVPPYVRPYMARSDPALNSGLVATMLAIKIALSHYLSFEKKHKIKLFPIVGVGTLPFRGGINPNCIQDFIDEYKGIRTAIIQSAFRYDFPKYDAKRATQTLKRHLPKNHAAKISRDEERELIELIPQFENPYQKTVEKISPLINQISRHLPKRRERVQHIGLFGYSRGLGKVRLPRAINFTAALYSLGVPPELIGTGRGLKKARDEGKANLIEKFYINLKKDIKKAGGFLYKQGLMQLAKKSPAWRGVWEDVQEIESYLLMELGPRTREQKQHYKLCEQLHKHLKTEKNLTRIIEKQALLRHSMG
ncbi:MAG: phosphoenolpyruvate carboxylase [Candidatus Doudnabacteria bacterium]|nr:phosphoenolpyruvate carboxylase [Candidatus Doudnabacteria bacterium]